MSKMLIPEEIEEQGINEAFEVALEEGTVTDQLGNPMTEDDFVEVDPSWGKEEFVTNVVLGQFSTLMGNVLTIIDASYEKERAKYVKDLVKHAFSAQSAHMLEML